LRAGNGRACIVRSMFVSFRALLAAAFPRPGLSPVVALGPRRVELTTLALRPATRTGGRRRRGRGRLVKGIGPELPWVAEINTACSASLEVPSRQKKRKKILFASRGHAADPVPRPSLPRTIRALLFTTGRGWATPPLAAGTCGRAAIPTGRRLGTCRKCVPHRGPIDASGMNSHLTWFAMLGKWWLSESRVGRRGLWIADGVAPSTRTAAYLPGAGWLAAPGPWVGRPPGLSGPCPARPGPGARGGGGGWGCSARLPR